MPSATTGSADFEVLLAPTVPPGPDIWMPLMLAAPKRQDGTRDESAVRTISGVLQAEATDNQIQGQLVTDVQEDWSRGVGIDYNWAPGVYTRTPGFALPAGAATEIELPSLTVAGIHASPIVAFAEYGGSLWALQEGITGTTGGGVMQITDSVGTPTGYALPAVQYKATYGGAGSAGVIFAAGEYGRDLFTYQDPATRQTFLYASVTDSAGLNGKLYRCNGAAASWNIAPSPASFGVNGRNRMRHVYWQGADGVGGDRLVAISGQTALGGQNSISYTRPNTNPMVADSWIENIPVGTAYALRELVGSRRHIYITADDGLYDLDELGNCPNLTSYMEDMIQVGNGVAAQYFDGYIYMSLGRGLDRIRVDQGAVLQENVGQCAPGWMTPAENDARGYVTAMTVDQGCLVVAIYNPTTKCTYIFWGKDRQTIGVQTPNPLVWWGPEVTVDADYKVTRMKVTSSVNGLRLWVAMQSAGTLVPRLFWVSLPIAGNPIQDLFSAGLHRFASGDGLSPMRQGVTTDVQRRSQLYSLRKTWGDKASKKIINQHDVGSRGLDGSGGVFTELQLWSRADATPYNPYIYPAAGWDDTWLGGDVAIVSPIQSIVPSAVTSGNVIETRVDFISQRGFDTPARAAILDSLRTTAWMVAPDLSIRRLVVEYGDGVLTSGAGPGGAAIFDPDDITANLVALTRAGRTTIRDRNNKRWTVKFHQVMPVEEELYDAAAGEYGKRVTATLEVAYLAGPL